MSRGPGRGKDLPRTPRGGLRAGPIVRLLPQPQSLGAEVAVGGSQPANADLHREDRKTHQLDFDGTWQWGHSVDAVSTASERTCIFYPFTPPPACIGLLCPSPATTQMI